MDVRGLLFPPGATRHDWVIDGAIASGLALMTLPAYGMAGLSEGPHSMVFLSALMMVAPVVLRRHSPLLMLLGVTLAGLVQFGVSDYPMTTLVTIPVVSYSVARWVPGPPARIVIVVGAIGAVLGPMRWILEDVTSFSLRQLVWFMLASFVCLGLVVTPYAIGRRVRESTEAHEHMVAVAEERYRATMTEREQQARIAEARARTQIARELHDIVAHSLSVMIVQAEGGRALAAKKPEAATEALTTIAETGREALNEVRRILGVLRSEPESGPIADFAPAPRLTDIPDLVQRTSDRVHLRVNGQPPRVSQALELTAYRVVQEALTNFLKHAGPEASATVTLTYAAREITIDVLDNGRGAQTTGQPPGHGLRGMHERVTSMGGRMVAAPRPHGGFQVTVVLPVTGSSLFAEHQSEPPPHSSTSEGLR